MTTTADYTITRHDPRQDTDDEIAERVAYANLLRSEILPDDPPQTAEQAAAAIRNSPARVRHITFRVRDAGGALVANATSQLDPEDDNPDVLFAGINVLPGHRRHALGARLLDALVDVAREEGKTRLLGATYAGVPAGPSFVEAIGGEAKQAAHVNHLPLAEVDRPMLEGWVAEAATRAAEYELIGWDGPVPDDHLANWLDLVVVMNTAPQDDLELNDFTLTAEQVRDAERQAAAMGLEHWTLVARHRPTGEWAGFHDVSWDPHQPEFVYVGATGVEPPHRGHALGKWLKAAMTLRILDERPDVTHVRTGNADSNDAMLGINRLMGYRPLLGQTIWEVPLASAEQWLARRGQPTAAEGSAV
jgi:GNAT superfamily N-acetyltransferase